LGSHLSLIVEVKKKKSQIKVKQTTIPQQEVEAEDRHT